MGKFNTFMEDKEYNIPGTNLYIGGFGRDVNGNVTIKVRTPNERARSLQVAAVWEGKTVRDGYWKEKGAAALNEVLVDYIEKYMKGMRLRKHLAE